MMTILWFFLASFIVDRASWNCTGRGDVEVSVVNGRFTLVCLRCRYKFGHLTLSFGGLRQKIILKYVPHVQHDFYYSFNQSDQCFLASSLPLPSSLLKLLILRGTLLPYAIIQRFSGPLYYHMYKFMLWSCHPPRQSRVWMLWHTDEVLTRQGQLPMTAIAWVIL